MGLLGQALGGAVTGLAETWRFELTGAEHLDGVRPGGQPVVWALWHGDILPLLWLHRNRQTTILVSRHRDGERLAALARRWGYRTLWGSSTRGGVAGLLGLIRTLRRGGQVAVAADGPRGPRGTVKHGAVAAAIKAGAPIVPVAATALRAWRLSSWDRFMVPHPGTRIRVAYGAPFTPSRSQDLEGEAGRLQQQLEYVSRLAQS